jgi:hypothetical protein
MCLACRPEIIFNTQVDLNAATPEPAAALGKFLGFFQFGHTQNVPVEMPGLVFSARRHGELDVIDRGEGDICHFWRPGMDLRIGG